MESELTELIQVNASEVIAVKVNSFAEGSVIVDVYFVLNATVAKDPKTPATIVAVLQKESPKTLIIDTSSVQTLTGMF